MICETYVSANSNSNFENQLVVDEVIPAKESTIAPDDNQVMLHPLPERTSNEVSSLHGMYIFFFLKIPGHIFLLFT